MGFSLDTGRSRSVNAETNLVPFIDVMSCLVAFLLLTAAWTHTAQLKIATRTGDQEGGLPRPAPSIVLTREAVFVGESRIEGRDYEALGRAIDALAARGDGPTVDVRADPGVAYQDVVSAMDTAVAHGFADVRYGVR